MMIEFVKKFIVTEKSIRLIQDNQYTFDVDIKLTKPQIRRCIEDIFKVNVLSVNTHRPPRKKRRLGVNQGYKSSSKRVIIKIRADQTLNLSVEDN